MKLQPGTIVVYSKEKAGRTPGPRAKNVRPARHGDLYWYEVDKYWIVSRVDSQGRAHLRTARGKPHVVAADDPHLRRLSLRDWLWLRLFAKERFGDLLRQLDDAGTTRGKTA